LFCELGCCAWVRRSRSGLLRNSVVTRSGTLIQAFRAFLVLVEIQIDSHQQQGRRDLATSEVCVHVRTDFALDFCNALARAVRASDRKRERKVFVSFS
jgi:hypothetical protein